MVRLAIRARSCNFITVQPCPRHSENDRHDPQSIIPPSNLYLAILISFLDDLDLQIGNKCLISSDAVFIFNYFVMRKGCVQGVELFKVLLVEG